MLNDGLEGYAAAYYDRKYAISRISKGSRVYLYHTGVGVIAKGEATSTYQITDYEGDPDKTYYVPLKFEWALTDENQWNAKAPKAWEINGRLGTGHRFRQTVFEISQDMATVIDAIFNERRNDTTQGT